MKIVPCSCGKGIKVDDWIYPNLVNYTFTCAPDHITTSFAQGGGKYKKLSITHLIVSVGLGEEVDHKDRDIHNCLDSNLRKCTPSQNKANRRLFSSNKSGYRGVGWHSRDEVWAAKITVNGKPKHLGYFDDIHQAAKAYNEAAIKFFGEFANLNEIPQ